MHHWLVVAADVAFWVIVIGGVIGYARRWGHLRKARKAPKLVIPPSSKWHAPLPPSIDYAELEKRIAARMDDGTAANLHDDWPTARWTGGNPAASNQRVKR